MNPALASELDTTRSIFASVNHPFPNVPGAVEDVILNVTELAGIAVSDDLTALWRLMDGSNQEKIFAVISDVPTPVNFLSTTRAVYFWQLMANLDEGNLFFRTGSVPRYPHSARSVRASPVASFC
jgi:hypothetical protein